MRVSSCVLLCLLTASLSASIPILDEALVLTESNQVYDADTLNAVESSRRLLVSISKVPKPASSKPASSKPASSKPASSKPASKSSSIPSQPSPSSSPSLPSSPAAVPFIPVFFTCDNEFEMFVNGNKVGSGTSWTTTYQFSIQVKPGDIIAVDGIDKGGPAAFIGVFNGKPTKATEWRCSTQEVSGWKMNSFDDSQWQHAISYGRNQDGNIWNSVGRGPRPNIPSDAEWLWTYNNENHNRVYCRYLMTPAPAPAPAPVVLPVRTVSDEVTVPNAADTDANANADSDDDNNDTPIATSNTSTTYTKQSVIDEIIRDKEQSNSKLTKFQEKLFRLLKENSDEQIKVETENRNNFNSVSVSLNDEKVKLESVHSNMIALYEEIQNLNRSIQSHYNKLISDTNYLQSLDEMRPTFLKSLDDLASHIQNVKIVVDNKIVNDEYKDEMIRLLTGIHFNTHNISGYVATAFINHYNKYKNRIQKENTDYLNDVKRLNELSSEYSVQKQISLDIEKDRVRLENIFLKMKETLEMSISQRAEFDILVKEVVAIFDKKRC